MKLVLMRKRWLLNIITLTSLNVYIQFRCCLLKFEESAQNICVYVEKNIIVICWCCVIDYLLSTLCWSLTPSGNHSSHIMKSPVLWVDSQWYIWFHWSLDESDSCHSFCLLLFLCLCLYLDDLCLSVFIVFSGYCLRFTRQWSRLSSLGFRASAGAAAPPR